MRVPWYVPLLLATALPVAAQDHQHHPTAEEVGAVRFETSCAPAVQPDIDRAVAMLHSFWFPAALSTFEDIARRDPACSTAPWGIAMTLMSNPFIAEVPPPAMLRDGRAAAERAVELAQRQTARELGLARAVLAFYATEADHRTRMEAHAAALGQVAEQTPADPEATIFHARALIGAAPLDDLAFRMQRRAAALLEPLFERMPLHPGLAHYLIHAFDSPQLAHLALDAAFRYADIAPAAPHALHMPSHIFTRLGYWDESIEMNRRSAEAEPVRDAAVHPMDYMVYAYLQKGQDAAALAEVQRARNLPDRFYGGIMGYNFAAMPARYVLERGAWQEAGALPTADQAAPFVAALPRFARGIGAARSGALDHARAEAEQLAEQLRRLEATPSSYDWHSVVRAQRLAVLAWIARAEGDTERALETARAAADLEETVEKHPVTPGPLLPARELLGDMLLELGHHREALVAYEATLEREPRRARSLFGAARAAELAGDRPRAEARYRELLELMAEADAGRAEPRLARAFLAR
jgi:hypothetical protein